MRTEERTRPVTDLMWKGREEEARQQYYGLIEGGNELGSGKGYVIISKLQSISGPSVLV